MILAIVLDIEGTVSPTKAVRDLYAYTYERLPQWLEGYRGGAAEVCEATRKVLMKPKAGVVEIADQLLEWLRDDVKAEPLKMAQGLICEEGFRSGELKGKFYDDVAPALIIWHSSALTVSVYSSGSVQNQKGWFGRLGGLIDHWFDLSNAGPKFDHESYDKITDELNLFPWQILFLSDHPEEVAAAAEAGWKVLGVAREDEPYDTAWRTSTYPWVTSLDEVLEIIEKDG